MCVVYQITLSDLQNVLGMCFDCGLMLTTKTKPDLNPLTFSVAVRLSLARILRQVLVIVIYYGYEK